LTDFKFYTKVIWPINMLFLGIASIGIFIKKGIWKNSIWNILFILVLCLPISLPFIGETHLYMSIISFVYIIFFLFIFIEIMKFLIRPGYINIDIISASACGYFLLLEISVFLMQYIYYIHPDSFKGIDDFNAASIYIDMVYFCSITFTSIGFGDIIPTAHYTKLLTSFLGISGQFYSVILVGILISKFSSQSDKT